MRYYTIVYYTIRYDTILYHTILYDTILYYTILYYTILYYTILYYTILYYTILYYTILYYTIVQLEEEPLRDGCPLLRLWGPSWNVVEEEPIDPTRITRSTQPKIPAAPNVSLFRHSGPYGLY